MKRKKALLLIGFILSVIAGFVSVPITLAYDRPEEITVGNSPPNFLVNPSIDTHDSDYEESISRTTFSAVGQDINGDSYYMLVCSSDGVNKNTDERYECNETLLCISNDAQSGTKASCRYHSGVGDNSHMGFLYLCDTNEDAALCSEGWNTSGGNAGQSTGILSSVYDEFPELENNFEREDVLGTSTENSASSFEFKFTNHFLLFGTLFVVSALFVFLLFHILKKESAERRAIGFLSFAIVVMITFYGLTMLVSPVPDFDSSSENIQGISHGRNAEDTSETVTLQRPSKAGLYEIFMEPDLDSTVVYYATESEPFPIIDEESGWLLILLPNGTSGWTPKSNTQ